MTSQSASPAGDGSFRPRPVRNLVARPDGKLINVARKTGQLFVCASGCCCGHTDRGFAPVPQELYHNEWQRRKLRNKVHLTIGGCLGPCPLANVAMLLFDGRSIWFHSFSTEGQVLALYDYIEQMLQAQSYLPPPPTLVDYHFTAFNWELKPGETHEGLAQAKLAAASGQNGFLFLTQADTDLLALAKAVPRLGPDFPVVKAHNVAHLKTEEDIDAFLTATMPEVEVVVLRMLGQAGFRGGLERVVRMAQRNGQWLICLPQAEGLDPELTASSNVDLATVHECMAYFQHGGIKNYEHLLRFLSDHLLMTGFGYDAPEVQPRHGIYHPDVPEGTLEAWRQRADPARPTIGVLFYRSHLLSGNTDFVDAIIREGEARGANVLPVYTYSLKDYPEEEVGAPQGHVVPSALRYFMEGDRPLADVLISTMSFAMGRASMEHTVASGWSAEVLLRLDIPVLQAINAGMSHEQWAASQRGLTPLDTGINVAIPEFDGRIITVPISFKEEISAGHQGACTEGCGCMAPGLGSTVVRYAPQADRVQRLVGQVLRLVALRRRPRSQKRVAFLVTNYNAKVSRIANAVGLDSPVSLLRIMEAMRKAGYTLGTLPPDGDSLLRMLVERGSYDEEVLTDENLAGAMARVPAEQYESWFHSLPQKNQREMAGQWAEPPGRYYVDDQGTLCLAGVEFGNVFVAIQPPRGYSMDKAAIYHMPDLPPPHPYHALYRWLSTSQAEGGWGADAVVHVGKHGTLEWLPGKGVGLSAECYPDLFLGDLPLVYPFIINDPGEGAQAKRRSHAVIVDHLTPPMTTAEGYGEIEELTRLVDEYYQLEKLDPGKLPLLQQQIWELIKKAKLDADLAMLMNRDSKAHTHAWDPQFHEDGVPYTISDLTGRDFAHLVENINGYLCELTSALIRDGLHILGQPPQGEQLVDTVVSMVRVPNLDVPSLRSGVAEHLGLDLDDILADPGRRFDGASSALARAVTRDVPTHADALEVIDMLCHRLVQGLIDAGLDTAQATGVMAAVLGDGPQGDNGWLAIQRTLGFIASELVPNLARTTEEVANLLHALDGGYVPAGPSGAPTRGMAHVLPTGRNFYTLDPQAMPSLAAWRIGQQLADALLARYRDDEGRYPESIGISIWGTSAMRTHGDDIAQVLALLGVRPRWQPESRRVVGVEVVPLEELGRPRIDVICRISGFFRDAFPHLVALLDEAFQAVAALDESPEQNFVRRHQVAERERLLAAGATDEQARTRAGYRIFGCKPGTYGAGILPLIDERNWRTAADFAEVYVNWGGYAYTKETYGADARNEFRQALGKVQVAVKNQDNREHDIFDSDDYLQYHGGMIASIRALAGKNPRRYLGDSSDPQRAKVRDLREEARRVFRTRVINPKWINSIQRHGYKGALELAATVDYIFGYDATSDVVDDWMYQRLAETYALDPKLQQFFRQSNPWALKDIAARLLEAADRGLWSNPGKLRQALEQVYLDTESFLESRAESALAASKPFGGTRQ